MALETKCKFYYGIEITTDNNVIDIDEGTGEINVTIPIGIYAPEELMVKLSALLTNAGTQTYTCTFNRYFRKMIITADSMFSILVDTGTHAASTIYTVLGYAGSGDLTGLTSYVSSDGIGYQYIPQFYLLDYIPVAHNVKSVKASINETASGNYEVIRYGTKRYMECSMELITNKVFTGSDFWTSSLTGVEDTVHFLSYATQKIKIEFMPDMEDVETYITLVLESTESDQQGIGFKLSEQLEYGTGYYKTGKLVFREIV